MQRHSLQSRALHHQPGRRPNAFAFAMETSGVNPVCHSAGDPPERVPDFHDFHAVRSCESRDDLLALAHSWGPPFLSRFVNSLLRCLAAAASAGAAQTAGGTAESGVKDW